MNEVIIRGLRKERTAATRTAARSLLRILEIDGISLIVDFLPDGEMKQLKKRIFPRRKTPANVLAIPEPRGFPHPEAKLRPFGAVLINKKMHPGPVPRMRMLIHGILHLAGYDHRRKNDILRMRNMEEKLWHRISSSV